MKKPVKLQGERFSLWLSENTYVEILKYSRMKPWNYNVTAFIRDAIEHFIERLKKNGRPQ